MLLNSVKSISNNVKRLLNSVKTIGVSGHKTAHRTRTMTCGCGTTAFLCLNNCFKILCLTYLNWHKSHLLLHYGLQVRFNV